MRPDMRWMNEPEKWSLNGGVLNVSASPSTDFWRRTFYGFTRDSGHFYFTTVTGDFTATVTIEGDLSSLYDQYGLMVRADEKTWVKAGAEYADGFINLSTVVTNGFSDWSVLPLTSHPSEITIRLTRHQEAVRVQYLNSDGGWQLLRLGYLDLPENCQVGMMFCAPEGPGFDMSFRDFEVSGPISRNLHD
jgi:regulation of enolase protein 1 (concanavalin A-like superfamily)